MYCSTCGNQFNGAARFCAHCGAPRAAHDAALLPAFERGMAALRDSRKADAATAFTEAATSEPHRITALLMLASIRLQEGKPKDAEVHLRQALGFAPDHAQAHAMLGSALLAQLRVEAAREELDRAIELRPDDFLTRLKRAEYHCRLGCYADARIDLEQALLATAPHADLALYARDLHRTASERARRSIMRRPLPFFFAKAGRGKGDRVPR